jgi:hypothetical protein
MLGEVALQGVDGRVLGRGELVVLGRVDACVFRSLFSAVRPGSAWARGKTGGERVLSAMSGRPPPPPEDVWG